MSEQFECKICGMTLIPGTVSDWAIENQLICQQHPEYRINFLGGHNKSVKSVYSEVIEVGSLCVSVHPNEPTKLWKSDDFSGWEIISELPAIKELTQTTSIEWVKKLKRLAAFQ